MSGYMESAKAVDWCTPPVIVEAVRAAFGGAIDLDPCGNEQSVVGAGAEFRLERGQDGLAIGWTGRVYVNPPFGRGLRAWVQKAVASSTSPVYARTIMLLPAAVDTRHWQQDIFPNARAICWVRGRIKFLGAKASAPMACALVYFGARGEAVELAAQVHAGLSTVGTVHLLPGLDQARQAGAAIFFKQAMVDGKLVKLPEYRGRTWAQYPDRE